MATKGWLPYGSTHSSVLFSEPLTSEFTDTASASLGGLWGFIAVGSGALGWVTIAGATHKPQHDATLGVKFLSVDDGTTHVGYRWQVMQAGLANIQWEGQISIEVSKGWLCSAAASNAMYGDTKAALECLMSALPTTGGAKTFMPAQTTNSLIPAAVSGGTCAIDYGFTTHANHVPSGSAAIAKIATYGKDDFVTVNLGWRSGIGYYAVDGVIVGYSTRTDVGALVNIFNNFYLGSDRGGNGPQDYWFRNFQMSNEAPMFIVCAEAPTIGILSDSIIDDTSMAGTYGDVTPAARIQRRFEQLGMYTNIEISENAGYLIQAAAGNTLHDKFTDVTDNKIVVIHGGANDAANSIAAATVDTDLKSLIEKIMGENGADATEVVKIYVDTPTSYYGANQSAGYAGFEALILEYKTVIEALPAWWDATYAARAGAVKVIDTFTALGGSAPTYQDVYVGQTDGSFTDIHWSANGNYLGGEAIADAIINNLGSLPSVT